MLILQRENVCERRFCGDNIGGKMSTGVDYGDKVCTSEAVGKMSTDVDSKYPIHMYTC